ncbi:MAG TPA: type II toxin-antitoxin system RelE/ParE family toxin [Mucilaginibacter sp.]|jgi:plasmid stabilization system protein ParE|nr:type II toxin-antitoxin system RelE/ParE family toxin [Mucilaginibacter sp.]
MVARKRRITWDKQALYYFRDAIQYIRKDSPQNADKVKKEVLEKINELLAHPEIHNPDKYKINNTGNYRAFELYRFRIGYLVKDDEIIIARIRNTNQEPREY